MISFAAFEVGLGWKQLRTKGPLEDVTENAILRYVSVPDRRPHAGDYYDVLVVEGQLAEPTRVVARGLYMVKASSQVMRTTYRGDHPHNAVAVEVDLHEILPVELLDPADPGVVAEEEPRVVWNVGNRAYEVKLDDKVVFSTPDKDLANRWATGQITETA